MSESPKAEEVSESPSDNDEIKKEAFHKGILYINEDITNDLLFSFYDPFRRLVESRKKLANPTPITVIINSCGGNAYMGIALSKMLASAPVPVTTAVIGFAASAAAMIFLGGHRRIVSPGSRVMVHDASTITYAATAEHAKRLTAHHDDLDHECVDWIVNRTHMDKSRVESESSKDHWYFNSSQAFQCGFSNSDGPIFG